MKDAREHEGRTAIITGGGRGFGKAFGHALAARGAHVVLNDIDADAGAAAAAEIRAAGGEASSFTCDVANEVQVGAMVADVVARRGGIDILINNAGLHSAEYAEPMAKSGLPKLRRLFDVNVMGVIICTLAARSAIEGRPGASIVNISSAAADGCPTAYGVTKLAVRGLTITSARELGPDGIRVNAIAPGLMFTETIRREMPQSTIKAVMDQQILKSEGVEKDIVEAILYLCSDRAALVTGETLRVSGGFALQV
jgi:NAD(P)-dependent dehydrogenase (short-subunit alcohol dehydrogenase family)